MGYDVMAAWYRQRSFEFNDIIQQRSVEMPGTIFMHHRSSCIDSGGPYQGRIRYDSPAGRSISRNDYDPPNFGEATSRWSPPASPVDESFFPAKSSSSSPQRHVSRPTSSHSNTQTTTTTPPRADSALQSPDSSCIDKASLASKLYAASTAGDLEHMALLISLDAPLNMPTLVPDLYEIFKPAKPGRLSPLAGAASYRQFKAAELLIANGADVCPDINDSSSSPLQQACRANDIEMVQLLLDCGANVNQSNAYKSTPLMYAVKYGSYELVSLILSYHPDLNAVSFMGSMATHWAIWPCRKEVLELLLKAGASPDDQMTDESTLLHCAALSGWTEGVKLLVNHGADPFRRDSSWKRPIDVATDHGHDELAGLLRAAMLLAS